MGALLGGVAAGSGSPAFAHEIYVLTPEELDAGLRDSSVSVFAALRAPHSWWIVTLVTLGVCVVLILLHRFHRSRAGRALWHLVERAQRFGLPALRLSLAIVLFQSARGGSFLGPELSFSDLPMPLVIQGVLVTSSALLFLGFLTEVAAAAALLCILVGAFVFGGYLFTYLHIVGALLALILAGDGGWSLDRLWRGRRRGWSALSAAVPVLVRVTYGVALVFTAVSVKLLHPGIPLAVVQRYDLTQFHWLFPSDPLLVVFGAAFAELTLGAMILFGYQFRFAVLVSLFYATLALLYFQEVFWTHLIMYGISFFLLVAPTRFALDTLLSSRLRRRAP